MSGRLPEDRVVAVPRGIGFSRYPFVRSTPRSAASPAAAPGGALIHLCPHNAATQGVIRASFHYTMQPGSTVTDSLVLANPTATNRRSGSGAADAYNTALGGALALRLDELSDDAGRHVDQAADRHR